jgi:hypothetical protein
MFPTIESEEKMKKLLLVLGIVGIGISTSSAATLCADSSTLQDLINLGMGGCTFGDKTYFDFAYVYQIGTISSTTPTTADVTASSVGVSFFNDLGDPWLPTLRLTGPWQANSGDTADITLTYSVSAPVSAAMLAARMAVTGSTSDNDPDNELFSFVSAAETVIFTTPPNPNQHLSGGYQPSTSPSGPVTQTSDTGYMPFAQASTLISFTKNIYMQGGLNFDPLNPGNQNVATVTQIDEGIQEVSTAIPEPVTFLLFGCGMVTIGLLARKKVKPGE